MATFKASFAAARKAGQKEFEWNGKKYNTKLKEETKKPASAGPKARPNNKPKSSAPKTSSRPVSRGGKGTTKGASSKKPHISQRIGAAIKSAFKPKEGTKGGFRTKARKG